MSPVTKPAAATAAPRSSTAVNRTESTAESIKQFILSNGLKPGDPLPGEARLCESLGVSRSSVREALRRLEALDIVNIRQGAGSFVGRMSMSPLVEALAFRALLSTKGDRQTLKEVVEVRQCLDTGLSGQLCRVLKGTSQPGLEALVQSMVAHAQKGETFSEADMAFHDGLLALAGNEVVRQLVSSLWRVHQQVVPTLGLENHDGLVATAKAHGAMLAAACNGDSDAFVKAVIEHYRPLQDTLNDE
ncbi:FadR/GntR family transcriptional regulator [Corynebacterium mendelii]|uniref:FadR family transcriptional regulator n=1 Tax=Corynebacterium mendelii TaxID=2765362 RepID=A0A939DZI4_9CORY|nr:FadR/GntR family transcriptional regulator [Corynebacterium mendelii]MBN9643694.1 FadR family transcriptional regulator [Corynebacterium mendelii]